MKSDNPNESRVGLFDVDDQELEGELVGVVKVPASEVQFVERAYRSSLLWLVGTGVLGLGLLGLQLAA